MNDALLHVPFHYLHMSVFYLDVLCRVEVTLKFSLSVFT